MKVLLFLFFMGTLFLGGCQFVEKKEERRFPIHFNLKSYIVVNYIPLRRGGNLDHLLNLEKWAQEKGRAVGLAGEGVLSLLDGRVDLIRSKKDPSKQFVVLNIVVSFEFKNCKDYEKRKLYFRVSEKKEMTDAEVPRIQEYLQSKLKQIETQFFNVIIQEFPALQKNTKKDI